MSNNNGNLFMVLKDGRFNNVIIYMSLHSGGCCENIIAIILFSCSCHVCFTFIPANHYIPKRS